MINDYKEIQERVTNMVSDGDLVRTATDFLKGSINHKYSYNFCWLSRPIIQYPQDVVAMQELIWQVRPDLIIETGIAHGGSLIFSASMLALLDICDAMAAGKAISQQTLKRKVIGIDIEIRAHNRAAVESHPLAPWIEMIQGSSVASDVISKVKAEASNYRKVLVCLDSNHTHEHVLAELEAYAQLVTKGSYCVVFDTVIEEMPASFFSDRPWGPGNNPKTAVWEFLRNHPEYEIDKTVQNKLLVTVANDGFLKKVK